MGQIVARCGCRCDDCRAFTANNHSYEDRFKVASAWLKYFGPNIPPEKLRCMGCWGGEYAGDTLPDPSCQIRACVIGKGMNRCADCLEYPCDKIKSLINEVG